MQVLYMRRDGIPVAVSTVVLAIVTITYKFVLVLAGALVFLLRPPRPRSSRSPARRSWMCWAGAGAPSPAAASWPVIPRW